MFASGFIGRIHILEVGKRGEFSGELLNFLFENLGLLRFDYLRRLQSENHGYEEIRDGIMLI